jgi:hypothetical protein
MSEQTSPKSRTGYKPRLYRNRQKRFGIEAFNQRLKKNYEIEHARMVSRLIRQKNKFYQGTSQIHSAKISKNDIVSYFTTTSIPNVNQYIACGTILSYNSNTGTIKTHHPNSGVKTYNVFDPKIYELFVMELSSAKITGKLGENKKIIKIELDPEREKIRQETKQVIDALKHAPSRSSKPIPEPISKPTEETHSQTAGKHTDKKNKEQVKERNDEERNEKKYKETEKNENIDKTDKKKDELEQELYQWTPEQVRSLTRAKIDELSRKNLLNLIKQTGRWSAEYRLTKKTTPKLRAFVRKEYLP